MKKNIKISTMLFWVFLIISLIALLVGILIKWANINTSHIETWTISNMFSPLKGNSWSIGNAFPFKWIGNNWTVVGEFWFNGNPINPSNFVFNIIANYAILIVSTVSMGLALIALIFSFAGSSTQKPTSETVVHEIKNETNNPNPINLIFNNQPVPNVFHTSEGAGNYGQTIDPKDLNRFKNPDPIPTPTPVPTPEPVPAPIPTPVPAPIPTPIPTPKEMSHFQFPKEPEVPVAPLINFEESIPDNNNVYDYLSQIEAKYALELKQQEMAEKLEKARYEEALRNAAQDHEREKILEMFENSRLQRKQMSVQERAKIDGSAIIVEPRSDLQKNANKMRSLVNPSHKTLYNADLRAMTKRELIIYMRKVANVINEQMTSSSENELTYSSN
ncbi:hypothetical protein [Williamsoniiplasma lucivorax]|uniref:Uncharacterized protein n=1 Tax=Williamsoniiplasma lucivorax TaxID=209274 RepID=A0A2S5RCT2_9MOLU|nr:hypothetical protein [Williamsoniiplasma lucivorax]PPE05139.1 hypothetical protein ELUCI_v1c06750 [Williamsoniiplasma lucivorax]